MSPRLLPRGPSALVSVAVGSAIAGLVLGMSWRGAAVVFTPTAVPGNSHAAVKTNPAETRPTASPVRATPWPHSSGSPRPSGCQLPDALPPAEPPAATPAVEADNLAMVFTSHVYTRSADGSIVTMAQPDGRPELGLWHVAPGSAAPRLLVRPPGGAVLPLAISPDGTAAVVWWLAERRSLSQQACISGLYLLSLVDGTSRLIASGDWSLEARESRDASIEPTWEDPWMDSSAARDYRVPTVSFSANGRFIAIVDGFEMRLYLVGEDQPRWTHVGQCDGWAWASTGATFVAGCEDTTSGWLVRAEDGYAPDSYALPLPRRSDLPREWLSHGAHAIGLTRDGDLRVVRFYGFPTGCMARDCAIPSPAWAITTLEPGTTKATVDTGSVDFLVDDGSRMAPDATWVYVNLYYGRGQRTLDLETGRVRRVQPLGEPAGHARAGSLLFGWHVDRETGNVLVHSLGRSGTTSRIASIGWPVAEAEPFLAAGLQVTMPR